MRKAKKKREIKRKRMKPPISITRAIGALIGHAEQNQQQKTAVTVRKTVGTKGISRVKYSSG